MLHPPGLENGLGSRRLPQRCKHAFPLQWRRLVNAMQLGQMSLAFVDVPVGCNTKNRGVDVEITQ
eukprot:954654-Prorocentrum_lima.AAC.1